MSAATITACLLHGFDDPSFGRDEWNRLLRRGDTNVVTLTQEWQQALWAARARETPLLVLAERDGEPVALAPFYEQDGVVMLNGAGYPDYLDVVGDVDTDVLETLLATARSLVDGFRGFQLDLIPDASRTGRCCWRSPTAWASGSTSTTPCWRPRSRSGARRTPLRGRRRCSPGQVLLRQLLLAAIDEGAHTFDFGLGDKEFKLRLATQVHRVRSYDLYPRRA